jgi:hypothetical protein
MYEKGGHRFELRNIAIHLDQRNHYECHECDRVNRESDPEEETLPASRPEVRIARHVLQELCVLHAPTVPRRGESAANRW